MLPLIMNVGYFMTGQGKIENNVFILSFKQKMGDGNNLTENIL